MGFLGRLGGAWNALTKGIEDAQWQDISNLNEIGNISVEALNAKEKSLSPKEQYENSIAVTAAISSIARNISKARWRIFTSDGDDEVTSGPLFDLIRQPMPRLSMRRVTYDLVAWFNISGEWNLRKHMGDDGVTGLSVLDPYRLIVDAPKTIPETGDAVTMWKYRFLDGREDRFSSLNIMRDTMFNPNGGARGLSPLITGQVEVSTGYHAARYNKSFFENGSIPSHILNLGEGVSKTQREDIKRRYMAEYGNAKNNPFKVMVVSGKEIEVKPLEQPFQDGAFMELRKWNVGQIAMLYHVPAIEMGIYDKTRFDTAAEERKLFVESTLMPQMDAISEAFQYQLVDPHFRYSEVNKTPVKMTKAVGQKFDEYRESQPDAKYIIMLDPDTLPIMAAVKAAQISTAKEFRETLSMSAKETADYFNIDLPEREERNDVYVSKQYINVTRPELNPEFQAGAGKETGGKQEGSEKAKVLDKKPASKEQVKSIEKAMRSLRKMTLTAMDGNELFSLEDADNELGDQFRNAIRRVRHELKLALNAEDPKRAAKDYFNALDSAALARSIYAN